MKLISCRPAVWPVPLLRLPPQQPVPRRRRLPRLPQLYVIFARRPTQRQEHRVFFSGFIVISKLSFRPRANLTNSQAGSSTLTTSTTQQTSMIHTVTTDTGGIIKTVTIMPTVTGDLEGGSQGSSGSSSKLAGGAIAGIVIGIVAALLFGLGLAFFLYRRRKQNESKADYQGDPSVRGSSSERMSSIRPEMSMTGASAASPTQNSNRNSTLQIDPRMDPFKQNLYARSGSHESINTLRDDHDYSRRIQQPKVLRATNPDPE